MPILFTHCTLSCLFFLHLLKLSCLFFHPFPSFMPFLMILCKNLSFFHDLFQKNYVIFFDPFQIFGPNFWSILIFMPIFFSHFTCSSPFCALSIFIPFFFPIFSFWFFFGQFFSYFCFQCSSHAIECQSCRPICAQTRLSQSRAGSTWKKSGKIWIDHE